MRRAREALLVTTGFVGAGGLAFAASLKLGDADAHAAWGFFLEQGGWGLLRPDLARAVPHYELAAEPVGGLHRGGNAWAQNRLACLLLEGHVVQRDPHRALSLLRQAAGAGNAGALNNLAVLQFKGEDGVQRDLSAALHNWKVAAHTLDNAAAQTNLAQAHEEGQGVPQDLAFAVALYSSAAGRGHAPAQYRLGVLHEHGRGVSAVDLARARFLYRSAAEQGHVQAQMALAELLRRGRGTDPDPNAAARWYQKGADQGHKRAMFELGVMLRHGEGALLSDPKRAAKLFLCISDHSGNAEAEGHYKKGLLRESGKGVPRDAAKAQALFRLAASTGQHEAALALGLPIDNTTTVVGGDGK